MVHIELSVQAKEWWNYLAQRIIAHNLGNGVRTILEWFEFLMDSCKAFFLQMKPDLFAHLKLMWHPMLIMYLLLLGIFHNGVAIYQPVG